MKKILLIEDDDALRENITEVLTLSNYTVVTASNGKKGIEAALIENPDLILCDVIMPELDGYGVLHILSRHPEANRIPFVFLTAKSELEDLRKGLRMGADDYLFKPFHETDLLDTVDLRLKKTDLQKKPSNSIKNGLDSSISRLIQSFDIMTSGKYERLQYKKKHILYTENQHANFVYYIVSGWLKEYRLHENGKELILDICTIGDIIGHRAVLEGVNYQEAVEVIEDAELMIIPANAFMQIIQSDMDLAQDLLGALSNDIHKKEERLLNMAYNSLRKKVANGIIQVSDKINKNAEGPAVLTISREDLAHVVGSAQESLIRTLKEFKNEKLIDIQGGNIVILNDQKLRNLLY